MPANSFAAIRPDDTNHAGEFIRRYSPRQYEWRPDDTHHAGEFIRRYSPVTSPHHVHIAFLNHHPMPSANHAGEFIRRYSPVTSPHPVHIAFPNHHVGANHAGEFIRRYSPVMAPWNDAQQKTHQRQMPPMRYGRNQLLA